MLYAAVYAGARTSHFGPSIPLLATAVVCSAVALVIGLIMFKSKPLMIKAILLAAVIIATIVAEAYSGAQEAAVLHRYGRACEKGVYVSRWTPFSNHAIYCGDDGEWVRND
jgi:predicted lysophospholipase L1 biosynthesis ABC-type transport system permease subunit